jgi:phospholipid/cholesterol/gamma-HCH transport system permease protein
MAQRPTTLSYAPERIAAWLYGPVGSWLQALRFAAITVVMALSPATYDRTMRRVAARQVYFSAWQALPGFALACAVLGAVLMRIVIGTAHEYGFSQYAVELAVRWLVVELFPLLAALFVALRSGAAIGARVALMHTRGELDTALRPGSDPLRHELVPRAIGSVVAVIALTAFGCALALLLAYEATYGLSPWGLPQFLRITGQVFGPVVVFGFMLKVLLFGLAVAAIPISAALRIDRDQALVPLALRQGMVRLALALVAIEVAFLGVMYA